MQPDPAPPYRILDPVHTVTVAHLTVLSDTLTAPELSALLGLPAHRSWRLGERDPHVPLPRYHGIEVRSRIDSDASDDAHVNDLLDRLEPVRSEVLALRADSRIDSVRLWIYQLTNTSNPSFSLEPATVARIAAFGLGLEIDPYVSDEDGDVPEERWQAGG